MLDLYTYLPDLSLEAGLGATFIPLDSKCSLFPTCVRTEEVGEKWAMCVTLFRSAGLEGSVILLPRAHLPNGTTSQDRSLQTIKNGSLRVLAAKRRAPSLSYPGAIPTRFILIQKSIRTDEASSYKGLHHRGLHSPSFPQQIAIVSSQSANMPAIDPDTIILGGVNAMAHQAVDVPSHAAINAEMDINEKTSHDIDDRDIKKGGTEVHDAEIQAAPAYDESDEKDNSSEDKIIITGADASEHLLPIRDDFDRALTFRSLFLATILSGFQAVMTQIYNVSSSLCDVSCTMCHRNSLGTKYIDISFATSQH